MARSAKPVTGSGCGSRPAFGNFGDLGIGEWGGGGGGCSEEGFLTCWGVRDYGLISEWGMEKGKGRRGRINEERKGKANWGSLK